MITIYAVEYAYEGIDVESFTMNRDEAIRAAMKGDGRLITLDVSSPEDFAVIAGPWRPM